MVIRRSKYHEYREVRIRGRLKPHQSRTDGEPVLTSALIILTQMLPMTDDNDARPAQLAMTVACASPVATGAGVRGCRSLVSVGLRGAGMTGEHEAHLARAIAHGALPAMTNLDLAGTTSDLGLFLRGGRVWNGWELTRDLGGLSSLKSSYQGRLVSPLVGPGAEEAS
jgi:hypothetical protein